MRFSFPSFRGFLSFNYVLRAIFVLCSFSLFFFFSEMSAVCVRKRKCPISESVQHSFNNNNLELFIVVIAKTFDVSLRLRHHQSTARLLHSLVINNKKNFVSAFNDLIIECNISGIIISDVSLASSANFFPTLSHVNNFVTSQIRQCVR